MGGLVPHQQAAVLLAAFLFLAVSFGATPWKEAEAAAPPPLVVGCVKCMDCSSNDANAFKELQVAIKCKSGADESYETKALGPLDDTGVFRIPLAAELLRDDGSMDRDCFAQLHSSLGTPCVGQAPPRIAPTSQLDGGSDGSTATTYLAAAADDTVLAPVACACGKKKKHFMFGPPPPPPQRPTPTPTPNPPTTPTYGPPMPTPTPVPPEPRPPAPEEPEPFFKKKPKLKFMHRKKPCPPLVDADADADATRPAAAGGQGQEEKLPKKLN